MSDNPRTVNMSDVGPVDRGSHPLEAISNYHKAVYTKITNADRMLSRIREEMDKLTNMGDTISPEDVVAAAGRVVGHGVPAREMATLLAGMPVQAGQGLAAWIQEQNALVQQQEAEVARVREIALHKMGVSAVRSMAAGDVINQARQASSVLGPLAPGGNQAIAPQAPPAGAPPVGAMASSAGALGPATAPISTPATPTPAAQPMMPIAGPLAPGER